MQLFLHRLARKGPLGCYNNNNYNNNKNKKEKKRNKQKRNNNSNNKDKHLMGQSQLIHPLVKMVRRRKRMRDGRQQRRQGCKLRRTV
mmetsp:Transcript_9329/g.16199  ORF Transcript_9329/g.16199 Transcript_9329/m.16199 type:complete len:87 (+) Transcript_9329:325-585(+)